MARLASVAAKRRREEEEEEGEGRIVSGIGSFEREVDFKKW